MILNVGNVIDDQCCIIEWCFQIDYLRSTKQHISRHSFLLYCVHLLLRSGLPGHAAIYDYECAVPE